VNESGKRSTTDLGMCAKDRATAPCIMPYHIDLPVIYKPRRACIRSSLHPTKVFPQSIAHNIWISRRWLHKEERTGEDKVGAAGESVAGKLAAEVEEAGDMSIFQ
jgi:hypothetical protein